MKNLLKTSLLLLVLISSSFVYYSNEGKKSVNGEETITDRLVGLEEHLACLNEDQMLKVSFESGSAVYTIMSKSSGLTPCGTTGTLCRGQGGAFGNCISNLFAQQIAFYVYNCGLWEDGVTGSVWCACEGSNQS